jgi:hypothetical protein
MKAFMARTQGQEVAMKLQFQGQRRAGRNR